MYNFTRRSALGLFSSLSLAAKAAETSHPINPPTAGVATNQKELAALPKALADFTLFGERNIMKEKDFGIANGCATIGINYGDVASISGFFAPPYGSSDFTLDMRLFGERVPTTHYAWCLSEVQRHGSLYGISLSTSTVLVPEERGGIIELTFINTAPEPASIPIQLNITGSLAYVTVWDFNRPITKDQATSALAEERLIVRSNSSGAFCVSTDLPFPRWEDWSSHWESKLHLTPGKNRKFYISFAIGEKRSAKTSAVSNLARRTVVESTQRMMANQIENLRRRLPSLEASDSRLVRYYNRSLVPFLLNKWTVPEFVLKPYYSTGGVNGGCLALYLWDLGCIPEMFPLADPAATREHIKQFLRVDMTQHFLIRPMDGAAAGPWYPVNQEKIILLIYHYVLHTGDLSFLRETVEGKSVLEWVIYHATFGDDFSKGAVLVDYGNGNNHLELRRQYRYDNILPDLNGRRCKSYRLAWELGRLVDVNLDYLNARIEPLRRLLKERLWSARDKWFYFEFADGKRELRYTVQMFEMIDGEELDREEEEGLVSHLNEEEFLSTYGLHSMSKKDPAYDQVDIDNGGGGNYAAFTPRIAEFLFNAGYTDKASDLLQRTMWWGDRVPYWGDSFVANQVEYRQDTPLQSDISAPAGAQCIIFGLFGVKVLANGDIVIQPRQLKWSIQNRLKGLNIRGTSIDISTDRVNFEVAVGGRTLRSKIGTAVRIRGSELSTV
jgi:hypothetical protein